MSSDIIQGLIKQYIDTEKDTSASTLVQALVQTFAPQTFVRNPPAFKKQAPTPPSSSSTTPYVTYTMNMDEDSSDDELSLDQIQSILASR